MIDAVTAEILVGAWGKTVNDPPEPGAVLSGRRFTVGSLKLFYEREASILFAMGLLFPLADRLTNPMGTTALLKAYSRRHPEYTHGAEIKYLSREEFADGDRARIVLILRFEKSLPQREFISSMKTLSSDTYRWRVEFIKKALDQET